MESTRPSLMRLSKRTHRPDFAGSLALLKRKVQFLAIRAIFRPPIFRL